jgi:hypothetical protein
MNKRKVQHGARISQPDSQLQAEEEDKSQSYDLRLKRQNFPKVSSEQIRLLAKGLNKNSRKVILRQNLAPINENCPSDPAEVRRNPASNAHLLQDMNLLADSARQPTDFVSSMLPSERPAQSAFSKVTSMCAPLKKLAAQFQSKQYFSSIATFSFKF